MMPGCTVRTTLELVTAALRSWRLAANLARFLVTTIAYFPR